MGIHVGKQTRVCGMAEKGFSLIEQVIAACLVLVASLCLLEGLAFCLLSLQVSEEKWRQDLMKWNNSQVEINEGIYFKDEEEVSGEDMSN